MGFYAFFHEFFEKKNLPKIYLENFFSCFNRNPSREVSEIHLGVPSNMFLVIFLKSPRPIGFERHAIQWAAYQCSHELPYGDI